MEQQKEKKRKDYKRRRRQSKSTFSFPMDLTLEILLRLPVKSVVRFRCVSKLWSSITTDPYFITSFETRSQRTSLLVCIEKDDNLFVSSIPQHGMNSSKSYSSSQPIDSYQVKLPVKHICFHSKKKKKKYICFPSIESVHGLICLEDSRKLIVWNPSMRRFLTLPQPSTSWDNIRVLFGYDPIEGKHKVLCFLYKRSCCVCRVLTLRSAQESWRTVRTNRNLPSYKNTSRQCIKGVIYYLAYTLQTHDLVLMSFDVRCEKFDMIELPSDIHPNMLITYEGKLASVKDKGYSYGITLWILEDAEKHKWSRKDFLAPFSHRDHNLRTTYHLRGVTHAGEFIYVSPYEFHQSVFILFCDPVRNSWRRFEFQGMVDDESKIYAFPNHTESLLSL